MKFIVVLLSLPILGLCQDTFREPPDCLGQEEVMPQQDKCSSTGEFCGGGTYTGGECVCNSGYKQAGATGAICIPQCTGASQTCTLAGGNCTGPNFCSCGDGFAFSNGQCLNVQSDACGGNCYLGSCTSGSCVCPQDYELDAAGTNCQPVANCPADSVAIFPNLCQCIGQSYYSNGACVNPSASSSSSVVTPLITTSTIASVTPFTTGPTTTTAGGSGTTAGVSGTTAGVSGTTAGGSGTTAGSSASTAGGSATTAGSSEESTETSVGSTNANSSEESTSTLSIFSSTTPGECSCAQIESITQQIIAVIQS